jgi:hypothetical protein
MNAKQYAEIVMREVYAGRVERQLQGPKARALRAFITKQFEIAIADAIAGNCSVEDLESALERERNFG